MKMDSLSLENYRCFRETQNVALAPLTLLVGENGTGKTSFLAMIRALWQIPFGFPSFRGEPYDLGSFGHIAHSRGGRGGQAESFRGGFEFTAATRPSKKRRLSAVFEDVGTVAFPIARHLSMDDDRTWTDIAGGGSPRASWRLALGTRRGTWTFPLSEQLSFGERPLPLVTLLWPLRSSIPLHTKDNSGLESLSGAERINEGDWRSLRTLADPRALDHCDAASLYAAGAMRSRPRRTYEPSHLARAAEGDHVPLYLANLSLQGNGDQWNVMKERLEAFGRQSGLFDEIGVKRFGTTGSEPFQLQIRKFGSPSKGPKRNLIDVGYGVSQALPVLAELLREDGPPLVLLQQPEVHLHPSAQAALGSLFCQTAADGRQLIVETHSDDLLNRVRMDVRDQTTDLRPEDVTILFFERRNLDVTIHSLQIDEEGNIVNAPLNYRSFFMAETKRSLRL